jgi:capsular polysaccharide biosynthesis protein
MSRFGYGMQAGLRAAAELYPEGENVPGPAILLTSHFGRDNYAHVLLDQVPRLFLSALVAAGRPCHVLIDEGAPPFCAALIGLIAPQATLVRLPDARRHRIGAVELISPLHHPANNGPPEILRGFRGLAERLRATGIGRDMPRRIFIARPAGRRGARNPAALAATLDRFGIVPVRLETLDCAAQIALFAGAELVVGAHGAGLANIVFCPPGARVVEVFQRAYGTPAYRKLAAALDLGYVPLADPDHDGGPSRAAAKFEDITFPVDLLAEVLAAPQPR